MNNVQIISINLFNGAGSGTAGRKDEWSHLIGPEDCVIICFSNWLTCKEKMDDVIKPNSAGISWTYLVNFLNSVPACKDAGFGNVHLRVDMDSKVLNGGGMCVEHFWQGQHIWWSGLEVLRADGCCCIYLVAEYVRVDTGWHWNPLIQLNQYNLLANMFLLFKHAQACDIRLYGSQHHIAICWKEGSNISVLYGTIQLKIFLLWRHEAPFRKKQISHWSLRYHSILRCHPKKGKNH